MAKPHANPPSHYHSGSNIFLLLLLLLLMSSDSSLYRTKIRGGGVRPNCTGSTKDLTGTINRALSEDAIASGLVTVILRTFSAPLPKRVVLNAFARRMRL